VSNIEETSRKRKAGKQEARWHKVIFTFFALKQHDFDLVGFEETIIDTSSLRQIIFRPKIKREVDFLLAGSM